MIINFVLVFTAFALNYPGKVKQRGNLIENDGVTDIHQGYNGLPLPQPWDYHTDIQGEIIIGDRLVTVARTQTNGSHIFDVYQNDTLNGEEVIAIKSTLPEGYVGALWTPGIPVIKRYLDTDSIVGQGVVREVKEEDIIECQTIFAHNFTWGYRVSSIGVYDFGYSVGSRWYLVISSIYGDPIESYAWDLGPGIDQFEPRYGLMAYRHEHSNGIEIEAYSKIVDCNIPGYPCLGLL